MAYSYHFKNHIEMYFRHYDSARHNESRFSDNCIEDPHMKHLTLLSLPDTLYLYFIVLLFFRKCFHKKNLIAYIF